MGPSLASGLRAGKLTHPILADRPRQQECVMTRRTKGKLLVVTYFTMLTVLTVFISCPRRSGPQDHPEQQPKVYEGHRFPVQSLAFNPDETTLTAAAFIIGGPAEVEMAVWDVRNGTCTAKRTIPPRDLLRLCFIPGNERFAAVGRDRSVWLGDPASARRLGETAEAVFALAFSLKAGLLATADTDNVVTLWDVASGQPRTCCKASAPVRALTFAPDGKTLAGGGNDKVIRLWDVATGEQRAILPGHTHTVWTVAFSPDGRLLASSGTDGVVKIWNVATEKELVSQETSVDKVYSNPLEALAFSPNGQTLAVACDRVVQLWDVPTGRRGVCLEGHQGKVQCLAFSPDGTRLASGSHDRTVRLWDVARYRPSVP
jgi:WD40 repeat protein